LRIPLLLERKELFAGKPKWTAKDMPDLTGRVACVTGGNSGIGYETCKALLENNAKVYLAARSAEKARMAIEKLKQETGRSDIHFLELDLCDNVSVRRAAEELKSKEPKLDILFHNAGIMSPPKGRRSAQGHEIQWATHVVGPFIFTKELLPSLLAAGKSPTGARLVWTSSFLHRLAPKDPIHFDDLTLPGKWDGIQYGQSKAAEILLSKAFAHKYTDQGILSFAVNPGVIRTGLQRNYPFYVGWVRSLNLIYHPAPMGAITQLYAGTDPSLSKAHSGKYFTTWARETKPRKDTEDLKLAMKLWDILESDMGSSGLSQLSN